MPCTAQANKTAPVTLTPGQRSMGNVGPPSGLMLARRFQSVQPGRLRRGFFVGGTAPLAQHGNGDFIHPPH